MVCNVVETIFECEVLRVLLVVCSSVRVSCSVACVPGCCSVVWGTCKLVCVIVYVTGGFVVSGS